MSCIFNVNKDYFGYIRLIFLFGYGEGLLCKPETGIRTFCLMFYESVKEEVLF